MRLCSSLFCLTTLTVVTEVMEGESMQIPWHWQVLNRSIWIWHNNYAHFHRQYPGIRGTAAAEP